MTKNRITSGFTLVELLVVIILVSVLVAIALPRYMDAVYRAKVSSCRENIMDLNTASQAFQAKYYGDSTTQAQLSGSVTDSHILITERFIDSAPLCPIARTNYSFEAVMVDGYTIGYIITVTDHFPDGNWRTGEHG